MSVLTVVSIVAAFALAAPLTAGSDTDLTGTWRAVLDSPGGELPFTLVIRPSGEQPPAVIVNGPEEAPIGSVTQRGQDVTLGIEWYDATITARLDGDGQSLRGRWEKTIPGGTSRLPFRATRDDSRRFLPQRYPPSGAPSSIAGVWSVTFSDDSGSEPARAEFRQDGNRVVGTFLTPTGDFRYLEGMYQSPGLRLSCFDGAHAFLFSATASIDGTLSGDFWSRDAYHATWTATKLARPEEDEAFDPWGLVSLTNETGRLRFAFPGLDGQMVSSEDEIFADQVLMVVVFGSWCPNCHDEAPLLAEFDRRYRARGLRVVGLAYEFSGDAERDRRQLRRFAARYGIEYPLLLAGMSDKKKAAETLPDLDRVVAYPTTIFVGRDGRVRKIHSGFAGPGTGAHHERLVSEFTELTERLLAEAP